MFQGLRTAIYPVTDLERAKARYRSALETQPYFDQPFCGIRVATVLDPFGNILGIIQSPHFQAPESQPA